MHAHGRCQAMTSNTTRIHSLAGYEKHDKPASFGTSSSDTLAVAAAAARSADHLTGAFSTYCSNANPATTLPRNARRHTPHSGPTSKYIHFSPLPLPGKDRRLHPHLPPEAIRSRPRSRHRRPPRPVHHRVSRLVGHDHVTSESHHWQDMRHTMTWGQLCLHASLVWAVSAAIPADTPPIDWARGLDRARSER